MHRLRLVAIALVAVLAICLQAHLQPVAAATATTGVDRIEQLKNQFLPAEYRNRNFTVDELKLVLREKCKKSNGGVHNQTLYATIELGAANLTNCLSRLLNLTAIQTEIEQARPQGELDTVFHKYCQKAPEAERCLRDFNDKLRPCLSAEERNQNAVMMRVASSLLGFMCAKGGDQIALFVAEEGPECMEANREAIGNCFNSSFYEMLPKDGSVPDLFNLPELLLEPKHCVDLQRFEKCTLHHLQQCREITPANVAESVFKFVKNETSCRQFMTAKATKHSVLLEEEPRGGGAMGSYTVVSFIAAILSSILPLILSAALKI